MEPAAQLPAVRLGWALLSLQLVNEALTAIVAEEIVLGPPEVIELLGVTLPPTTPIGTSALSRRFQVTFHGVVAYQVLPENCAAPDPHGEPAGNPRRYLASAYLDTLRSTTAVFELHGPGLQHFELITEHLVIDVLCTGVPSVTEVAQTGV